MLAGLHDVRSPLRFVHLHPALAEELPAGQTACCDDKGLNRRVDLSTLLHGQVDFFSATLTNRRSCDCHQRLSGNWLALKPSHVSWKLVHVAVMPFNRPVVSIVSCAIRILWDFDTCFGKIHGDPASCTSVRIFWPRKNKRQLTDTVRQRGVPADTARHERGAFDTFPDSNISVTMFVPAPGWHH